MMSEAQPLRDGESAVLVLARRLEEADKLTEAKYAYRLAARRRMTIRTPSFGSDNKALSSRNMRRVKSGFLRQ